MRTRVQVSPGIYAFDLLSSAFCEQLLCELEHYEASGLPVARPNSMNNYGIILNSIGLEGTMDALQRFVVRPIAQALFPVEGECVDHHHSFMVPIRSHTTACSRSQRAFRASRATTHAAAPGARGRCSTRRARISGSTCTPTRAT